MTDDDFLRALADCSLPEADFDHVQHVRLGYLLLHDHDLYGAMRRARELLQGFAASLGRAERYHETITMAFVVAIHARMRARGAGVTWAQFAKENPSLLEKGYLLRHYGEVELAAPTARDCFLLPSRAQCD